MINFDRINLYTARRFEMMDLEKFTRLHAEQDAGFDRLSDLCETVQDAVREVIEESRQRGKRCAKEFEDLRIDAYAYPHQSGDGICWGVESRVTGVNTKRGIVE